MGRFRCRPRVRSCVDGAQRIRHSPWLAAAASATGTLLVVDAWLDVLTAQGGGELAVAAFEAVLVELPLAALSFWIVGDAERAIQALCDCLRIGRKTTETTAVGNASDGA